jgi:hypothetical protein
MIQVIVVTLGIFAALSMSAIIPQFAVSQSAPSAGTNDSLSAGISIPPNDSSAAPVPTLITDPVNGLVIRDPSGDDFFTKDCKWRSLTFSPGAVVVMGDPPVNKTCQSNGTWK